MKRNSYLFLTMVLLPAALTAQNTDGQRRIVTDSTQTLMTDTTFLLQDITVSTTLPRTKLKAGALVTKIQGSVLGQSGTAYEMLGKVPGMMQRDETLEVIGKGAPLYYLNGRKLSDTEELKRLRSEEVLDVEVINNPGAQYDATVSAVVRIRTRRPQGEGFGFDLSAQHNQDIRYAVNADPSGTFNLNYRHKGLDLFGMINGWTSHTQQISTADQHIYTSHNDNRQVGGGESRFAGSGMSYALGANWMASEKHSMGFRLQLDKMLSSKESITLNEDIYNNGVFYQQIHSETKTISNLPLGYNLNTYYNGQWGKLSVDWNFDWHRKGGTEEMEGEAGTVRSSNHASSNLLATKLVLNYPLWKGLLSAGTEMTWISRDIDYRINKEYIANSLSKTHENTYSGFVEYSANLGDYGMIKAGVRYEQVIFDYKNLLDSKVILYNDKDHPDSKADVLDTRHGLYPSVAYSVSIHGVDLSMSYAIKTIRPVFFHLNDATTYASPSILMQGNSQLRNQIRHEMGINARWRWMSGAVNFVQNDHQISQWTYPYVDDNVPVEQGVIVYRRINLPVPVRTLVTFVNASPTFGCLTMNYTLGYQQQFLTMMLDDSRVNGKRHQSFNDPIFFGSANNTLRLPHDWQLECNLNANTPGHVNNYRLMTWTLGLNAVVQKQLLRDKALTLRLSLNDILYHTGEDLILDCGDSQMRQANKYASQRLCFSMRYAFNSAKSKYKGTGAGKDVLDRMK